MILSRLFLLTIYASFSYAAVSEELCEPDGTPNLNYKPIKSEYFSTLALAERNSPLASDEIHIEIIRPGFGLLPSEGFGIQQNAIVPPELNANQKMFLASNSIYNNRHEIFFIKRSYGTERVIDPPPEDSEGNGSRQVPLPEAEQAELSACRKTIASAKGLDTDSNPSEVNPHEACALLQFDKNCLTNKILPDAFEDKTSFRKAIVGITSQAGQPYCMGALIKSNGQFRLITSRHCFVNRSTGKLDTVLKLRSGKTLDEKRLISIHENDLKKLEVPCSGICELPKGAYGPERDAITVRVTVKELPGATSLPEVKMDPTVKGCITSNLDDLNDICARVIVPGVVPDLLAAKKLESQATKVTVSGTWLDEIRWPKWFGGYTRIDYLEEHCAYYTSQTLGGFSGAPLITRTKLENNQPVVYIAGVHSGATSASDDAWPACVTAAKNPSSDRLRLNIADVEVDKP